MAERIHATNCPAKKILKIRGFYPVLGIMLHKETVLSGFIMQI